MSQASILQADQERKVWFREPDPEYNSPRPSLIYGANNSNGSDVNLKNPPSTGASKDKSKAGKDTIDMWLEKVEQASKVNSIHFSEMVRIEKWPHGEIFFWLLRAIENQLEIEFFKMIRDHLLDQKKGPVSLFDDILQDPSEGSLSQWLARAKARAMNKP